MVPQNASSQENVLSTLFALLEIEMLSWWENTYLTGPRLGQGPRGERRMKVQKSGVSDSLGHMALRDGSTSQGLVRDDHQKRLGVLGN